LSTRELIQDLRAHAHEAPTPCAALMRRAATELEEHLRLAPVSLDDINRRLAPKVRVKGEPCN
jgi:hypothetical protein